MIVEKYKEDENKVSYIGKLNNDTFILNVYMKNKYDNKNDFNTKKIKKVKSYKYGDYISIKGKISIPELLGNIGEFDYKKYLNSKDICGIINAYEVEYVDNIGNKIMKLIYSFKQNISDLIDKKLPNKEAELLKSMLYGDTKNLDEDIKENFNEIGISHITAVSGSNLNILLLILSFVCYKLKTKRKIYLIIQICIISFFCILAGLELSVMRAAIMNCITIVCKYKNIKLSTEKILLLTLYIMTLLNPFRIYNIGMLFSFLAILGLVFFSKRIYNFFESKIKWNIKNKRLINFLCYISNILAVTISVNILVLPLSIYSFNKLSLMFVLSNLLVSTLATCINILGIVSIILTKIPLISTASYFILELLLKIVIYLSKILNDINFSIKIRSFPIFILISYYTYIVLVCIKFKTSTIYIKRILDKINKKSIICFVISIIITLIYNTFLNNYIYFFNVGQGEMAVIKKKDTVIMVDSGSITNNTSYIFEAYMKKENIHKIDALVISHFHSDHINGIKEIIKLCKIDCLIYAYPYDMQSEEYVNLMQSLENENIKNILVKAGDDINIDGIKINILFPTNKYICVSKEVEENENANSLVVNFNINNQNYLFMGDALKESEKYVIQELKNKNIDNIEIIKIGHHGSKTSTSEIFIQSILPRFAVISCKKKVYNHPNSDTIYTLNKYSVKTYITEKIGGLKYII